MYLTMSREDEETVVSTVVLLGAGASHGTEYRLPVMRGFFNEIDTDRYEALVCFIKERCYHRGMPQSEWNLEEVMTHLQILEEAFLPASANDRSWFSKVHGDLDAFVYQRLVNEPLVLDDPEDPVTLFKPPKLLKSLFAGLNDADSILSLNYDLVADGVLYELAPKGTRGRLQHDCLHERSERLLGPVRLIDGDRATLRRPDFNRGYFIKLHGSVDWYYCSRPDCPNHRSLFWNWPGSADAHASIDNPCCFCGSGLTLAIIPPAMGKKLDELPKFRFLWHVAALKLSQASRWIIYGVSFAESDYYLRVLLREARARLSKLHLVVINPCREHREKAAQLLRPDCTEEYEDLAAWFEANSVNMDEH